MKIIVSFLTAISLMTGVCAQEFDKNLATAKSSYASGDLENARFAMEQMMRDLDMAIGKEVLKLLPVKAGVLNVNPKDDNVTGGGGTMTGLFVHRSFGAEPKSASIEIINNSPMINSIQAILTMPLIGGMMRDENQKVIKVQGYKSLLQKNVDSETNKTNYELQIPFNNTLLTVKMDDTTEAEITGIANAIPIPKIAQIAQ
jgi:hypothetical protein